jgi:hypothetical protein
MNGVGNMTILTYISSTRGDWCGIYLDNTLHLEGHSIHANDWLDVTLMDISHYKVFEVDAEWLEEGGNFPLNFRGIPKEKLE